MPSINIFPSGDGSWPDLATKNVTQVTEPIGIAILEMGMNSGRPSVTIRLDLPNGDVVLAETSARLFVSTARVILAKYPGLMA